ncbi:MAG: EAL domain-containing protein [Myxococcales bacterium]|nr:EAL domain-containing protein [Myxococcales bacterium]
MSMSVSLAIPDPLRGAGRLFLWMRDADGLEHLQSIAVSCGMSVDAYPKECCLAVHVAQSDIINFLTALRKELSEAALTHTRALFKPGMAEPTLSDFPRADSLVSFIVFARGKWLGEIMAEDRLTVHYQPIVGASDIGTVLGYEALARAASREGELIGPSRLLSAARDAGLITLFDTAVHEVAIRGMADSKAPGRLFVNVSSRSATDPAFQVEHFRRLCRIYRVEPERLVIEITEGDRVGRMDQLVRFFREAQDDGFGVALDDLGEGFSNINLIHQLRPDILKMDMALTRDIHRDPYKAIIAKKIFELAAQLGMHVVAEGVETSEELAWVRDNGAHMVQGYLIGRPDELPRDTHDLAGR